MQMRVSNSSRLAADVRAEARPSVSGLTPGGRALSRVLQADGAQGGRGLLCDGAEQIEPFFIEHPVLHAQRPLPPVRPPEPHDHPALGVRAFQEGGLLRDFGGE